MRYSVVIFDFGDVTHNSRIIQDVSLAKAWRIVKRAARRGVKRYGGNVSQGNWGAHGGDFPREYRAATIRMHGF